MHGIGKQLMEFCRHQTSCDLEAPSRSHQQTPPPLDIVRHRSPALQRIDRSLSMDQVTIRVDNVPRSPPPKPHLRAYKIRFRHPGYPPDKNTIIQLYASDLDGQGRTGLHHDTALLACTIVAGNASGGWFSQGADGERIREGPDDLLTAADYYFHLPRSRHGQESEVSIYPICPNFSHWQFPHDGLPAAWDPSIAPLEVPAPAPSNLSQAVLARDGSCRMSAHRDSLHSAHLVPRHENRWFERSTMSQYNLNQHLPAASLTEDIRNAVALRADLHASFDAKTFVFVPKAGRLVTHMLESTYTIGTLYQNVPLLPLGDESGSLPFLLARFAWALFPLLTGFLAGGMPRVLVLVRDAAKGSVVEEFGADECEVLSRDTTIQSRHGTPVGRRSPTKRPRPMGNGGEGGSWVEEWEEDFAQRVEWQLAGQDDGSLDSDTTLHKRRRFTDPNPPSNGNDPDQAGLDSQELAGDLETLGKRGLSKVNFFVTPGDDEIVGSEKERAPQWIHENMTWYPGHKRYHRMAQRALASRRPEGWDGEEHASNPGPIDGEQVDNSNAARHSTDSVV